MPQVSRKYTTRHTVYLPFFMPLVIVHFTLLLLRTFKIDRSRSAVEKMISSMSTFGKTLQVSDKLVITHSTHNDIKNVPIKTPVSILQEIMIKSGEIPKYDIQEDESLPKIFNCVVTCSGLSATGTGHSKKDAKHKAAQKMIGKIRESIIELNSTKVKEEKIENEENKNHITKLLLICSKDILKKPEYKIVKKSDSTYFCQCSVSTLQTIGTGETSEKAMNDAAEEMIKKINHIFFVDDLPSNTVNNSESLKTNNSTIFYEGAFCEKKKLYFNESTLETLWIEIKQLLSSSPSLKTSLMHICNLANEFNNEVHKSIENISVSKVEKLMTEFYDFLKAVEISFDEIILKGSEANSYLYMIQLNTSFEIIEKSLGSTKEQAQLRTIRKVIKIFEKNLL